MSRLKADAFEIGDHAARARLSRIIRNSEAGWLFYSPGGTAYHLLSDEAEMLERRGLRRLDKCEWLSRELGVLATKGAALSLVVFVANIVLVGRAYGSEVADFVATIIFPSLLLGSVIFAVFRPAIARALRATIMIHWQATEASRLRKSGRGAVPDKVEKKHLRYNLFRIAFGAASATLIVRLFLIGFLTPTQIAERGFAVELVCIAVIVLTAIPAKMIDVTHIRRKWFD